MAVLNIVLVEPEIPQNTGNIARTCAVTGARLHLIEPLGFKIDDKKLKHAGLDYWQYLDITIYDGLEDFFKKNNGKYFFFSTKARHVYSDVEYPDGAYLLVLIYQILSQLRLMKSCGSGNFPNCSVQASFVLSSGVTLTTAFRSRQ